MIQEHHGKIYTFYSYKGGVGRSMSLANVASLLVKWGKKVLIVDWDLEAPGLHEFFKKDFISAKGQVERKLGMLDILLSLRESEKVRWQDHIIEYHFGENTLHLISAGKQDEGYLSRLQHLNWQTLIEDGQVYNYLNELRREWKQHYDYILIDSRTGVTDIGDICTVLLPDVLVLLFVSNWQNIKGIKSVIGRSREAHNRLPVDRTKLLMLPVPSRTEVYTEYHLTKQWQRIFAEEFKEQYYDWIPNNVEPNDILNKIFIPYIANWSFGEALPVLENEDELYNPTTVGNAYSRLANLILHNLDWNKSQGLSVESLSRDAEYRDKLTQISQDAEVIKESKKKVRRRNYVSLIVVAASIVLAFLTFYFSRSSSSTPNLEVEDLRVAANDTLYLNEEINSFNVLTLENNAHIKLNDTLLTVQLIAEEIRLLGSATIDGSGTNGASGKDGRDGNAGIPGQNGQRGEAGGNGENGGNGKDLVLQFKSLVVAPTDSMVINLSGGSGGHGGNGGAGGFGGIGNCSNRRAGDGGNGGNGGNSGYGGSPGRLNSVTSNELNQAIRLHEFDGATGDPGLGGEGGQGGQGTKCNIRNPKLPKGDIFYVEPGKKGQAGNPGLANEYIPEASVNQNM